jgi:hypothetical protein
LQGLSCWTQQQQQEQQVEPLVAVSGPGFSWQLRFWLLPCRSLAQLAASDPLLLLFHLTAAAAAAVPVQQAP